MCAQAKKGEVALAALKAKIDGKGGRPWLNQNCAAKATKVCNSFLYLLY